MSKFARTTDGKIHRIFSDNVQDETMDLIDQSQWSTVYGAYDSETAVCTTYPYSQIVVTDPNLSVVMIPVPVTLTPPPVVDALVLKKSGIVTYERLTKMLETHPVVVVERKSKPKFIAMTISEYNRITGDHIE